MSYIVVDIESDGPIPGDYSMICFGAVLVDEALNKSFYGRIKPISENYIPEALAISGFSREETLSFDHPVEVMQNFENWIKENSKGKPIFISDNNGFDWMFICWYFHHFLKRNPFGYSSRRLSDLYCGLVKDSFAQWRHLRTTKHTHNPVDDAKGVAEALLYMKNEMNLKIGLK
ncbi:MAG: exonuclease [Sphingobacteriales bacterium]|nr:exonuclease [Sphingobacteriales bacterium]MBP9142303.1 exonuclease [Chitinophagales bacterium]MDA0199519.1 exonuclease [Bacteroidota bacterium]MBK6891046.1 exonuclease [Sphingobacteriales bacterium]MBK7527124.1 exonuclease [Sphingobacteriales bacterium]